MVVAGLLAIVIYMLLGTNKKYLMETKSELIVVFSFLGMALGAKIMAILVSLPEMIQNISYLATDTLGYLNHYILGAGFVFYGGLYGCLLTMVIFCKVTKSSFSQLTGPLIPVIPLFHAFGRIGCFLEGCCYGKPTDSFIGVTFHNSLIAPNDTALLPVQLFESGFEFVLFVVIHILARKYNNGRMELGVYMTAYAVWRFIIEFFRYDSYRGFIGPLSVSQVISIITLAIGLIMLFGKRRKAENIYA